MQIKNGPTPTLHSSSAPIPVLRMHSRCGAHSSARLKFQESAHGTPLVVPYRASDGSLIPEDYRLGRWRRSDNRMRLSLRDRQSGNPEVGAGIAAERPDVGVNWCGVKRTRSMREKTGPAPFQLLGSFPYNFRTNRQLESNPS
jgi:hypothetical protein